MLLLPCLSGPRTHTPQPLEVEEGERRSGSQGIFIEHDLCEVSTCLSTFQAFTDIPISHRTRLVMRWNLATVRQCKKLERLLNDLTIYRFHDGVTLISATAWCRYEGYKLRFSDTHRVAATGIVMQIAACSCNYLGNGRESPRKHFKQSVNPIHGQPG